MWVKYSQEVTNITYELSVHNSAATGAWQHNPDALLTQGK